MHPIASWARNRFHYAWIAIAVTFVIMLVTAGIRATPSVMMVPLERSFGWSRTTISLALAINLALFGLMGPFAAAAMQRFGMRRTVIGALAIPALRLPWLPASRVHSVLSDQRPQPLGAGARSGFHRPAEQLVRVRSRQRPAEQESLRLVAIVLLQEQELRKALDALRGHVDPQ
jgi:hypothetical protein